MWPGSEAGCCEGNWTIIGMEAEESSVCVAGERGWMLWEKLHYYKNGGWGEFSMCGRGVRLGAVRGNCTIIGMVAEGSSVCVAGERGWVLWGKLHYYRNGGWGEFSMCGRGARLGAVRETALLQEWRLGGVQYVWPGSDAACCERNCTIIGMEAEENSVCVAGESDVKS